jgi:hypothetical protein
MRWLIAAFIEVKYMKWEKPNGSVIETNDLPDTIEAAKKLGWKQEVKSVSSEPSPEEQEVKSVSSEPSPEEKPKPKKKK